jgi:hypothetical protein
MYTILIKQLHIFVEIFFMTMDNDDKIITIHISLLKELDHKWDAILEKLEDVYRAKYLEDWNYTSTAWSEAYEKDKKELIKKHNIDISKLFDSIDFRAGEKLYEELTIPKEQAFFFGSSKFNSAQKKAWFDSFEEFVPYLSSKDIGFNEGLKAAQVEREKEIEGILTLDDVHKKFSYIASLIEDSKIIDQMLTDKKSLKDTLLSDPKAAEIISEHPDIEKMVDAFSDTLDYTKKTLNNRNPNLGTYSKTRADQFAIDMGVHLTKLEEEGITSTRKIAEKLNELGIESNQGKNWHHNSVAVLLRRRKEMGLNNDSENTEPETPTAG